MAAARGPIDASTGPGATAAFADLQTAPGEAVIATPGPSERTVIRTQLEGALRVFQSFDEVAIADCLIAALAYLDRQDDV